MRRGCERRAEEEERRIAKEGRREGQARKGREEGGRRGWEKKRVVQLGEWDGGKERRK